MAAQGYKTNVKPGFIIIMIATSGVHVIKTNMEIIFVLVRTKLEAREQPTVVGTINLVVARTMIARDAIIFIK